MNNQKPGKRKYIEIAVHVFVWALVLNMNLLMFNDSRQFALKEYLWGLLFPATFAFVFYFNYFLIIPRLLFTKRMLAFFLANIMLYASALLLTESTSGLRFQSMGGMHPPMGDRRTPPSGADRQARPWDREGRPGNPPRPRPWGRFPGLLIALTMTTGVAVAIHTTKKWFQSEEIRTSLEREHLKSELANLKNQLNPHFFFNTLNNIYSLISQDQQRAQESVHQLSKLMRYLLYDSNEKFVPLNKEIDFMHNYIDLMKLRITPNVLVTHEFPKNTSGISIAPLLFISLIENSFKHGISLNAPSRIQMDMSIVGNNELIFRISNTSFPKSDSDRSGSGIGIDNLKKRLALLYPGKHELTISHPENYYETTLKVNL